MRPVKLAFVVRCVPPAQTTFDSDEPTTPGRNTIVTSCLVEPRRPARTDWRITRAFLAGRDVLPIVALLTLPDSVEGLAVDPDECRIRAIVRAARVCDSPTPLAYYDAWGLS